MPLRAQISRIPVLATGVDTLLLTQTAGTAGRSASCRHVSPLEVTMHDPFFFDRLLHAFTTANSTPLSHAAEHGETGQSAAESSDESSPCRVIREAEAVMAEALRCNHARHSGTPQADGHA